MMYVMVMAIAPPATTRSVDRTLLDDSLINELTKPLIVRATITDTNTVSSM